MQEPLPFPFSPPDYLTSSRAPMPRSGLLLTTGLLLLAILGFCYLVSVPFSEPTDDVVLRKALQTRQCSLAAMHPDRTLYRCELPIEGQFVSESELMRQAKEAAKTH